MSSTQTQQLDFFDIDDKPYGWSWNTWSIGWWQWATSMPKDVNAGMGSVGPAATVMPNVVFLVGAFDTVNRYLRHDLGIPAGKSLFFPVINCTNCFADTGCFAGAPQMKTEDDLRKWAVKEIGEIGKREVTINGVQAPQEEVISEPFDLNYPENNVFDIKPGPTTAISAGYWVFIKSLPKGEYDIETSGACMLGKIKIDAGYHIKAV